MAFPTLYFAQRIHLWIKSKNEKQKGLGIHQVPITTKQA